MLRSIANLLYVVLLWLVGAALPVQGQEAFRFSVFGLFQSTELLVQSVAPRILLLQAGKETVALEGATSARLVRQKAAVHCEIGGRTLRAPYVSVRGRGASTELRVEVPGKIERQFRGTLEVSPADGSLLAVVTMDLVTAVASIVAAESPPGASFDALRAQAVVTRSYLFGARGRHTGFDFCDTTHCQYLREPPPSGGAAWRAAVATRGLVLAHKGLVVPALYSRSCGGQTRSLQEVGMTPGGYPYYPVECPSCRRSPEVWQRRLPAPDAETLLARTGFETARLRITRALGWSAVPSNSYRVRRKGDVVLLRGQGAGHGVGLCQRGAQAMAAQGADMDHILQHYFPNTALSDVD